MKTLLLTLLVSACVWGYGENTLYWLPHNGHHGGKPGASAHGAHPHGGSTTLDAMNREGNATVQLIRPDLSIASLPMKGDSVTLPKPTMGGYYALVATTRMPGRIESAVRYLSLHGRPANVSPTRLTALRKSVLEIVPNPLHREHDRYTASKTYRFTVMFEGHPLPNASLFLETRNSQAVPYRTDTQGNLAVTLPNDFEHVNVGRSENRPSEFLLSVEHRDGETSYLSTFSMPYYVNPNDYWQSQQLGAGAMLIGFLGGLLLYRRTQGVNHG